MGGQFTSNKLSGRFSSVFLGVFFKPSFEKVKENIKVRGSRPPIQKHLRYLYIDPRDLKEEEG